MKNKKTLLDYVFGFMSGMFFSGTLLAIDNNDAMKVFFGIIFTVICTLGFFTEDD